MINKFSNTGLIYLVKLPNIKLNYLVLQNICLILWIYHFIDMGLEQLHQLLKDILFLKLKKLLSIEWGYHNPFQQL